MPEDSVLYRFTALASCITGGQRSDLRVKYGFDLGTRTFKHLNYLLSEPFGTKDIDNKVDCTIEHPGENGDGVVIKHYARKVA